MIGGKKMIRELQISDIEQVMKLWLCGNKDAHYFIQEEYWSSHFDEVQEALLQAKVFVYDTDGKIQGFIGMVNEYIAGIFVDKNYRSTGIGTQLLNFVKQKYDTLSLSVYEKNARAVEFYHREGFSILSEGIDENTGEKEYSMFWEKAMKND